MDVLYSLCCINLNKLRKLFMAVRLSMLLHPIANVANKTPRYPRFHAVLNKKFRTLIFVDLLEVEATFKDHIAGFLNIFPKGLTTHP